MSVQILEKLFGSAARLKLMKLFVFNSDQFFSVDDIAKKTRLNSDSFGKEIIQLHEIKLIKKSTNIIDVETKKGLKKKKISGYILNKNFAYLNPLKSLLINTVPLHKNDIVRKLSRIGALKLVIVSGIFLQVEESVIDLLIVIDHAKETAIQSVVSQIESDLGKEIRYTVFSSPDFKYRLGLYDHLMRDIFDFPHQVLLDKNML